MPSALNNPLMVYEWGTKARSLIVITDMTLADGRKITGAVALERDGVVAELNELASVHGKSLERLLNDATVKEKDFGKNKLKYVDKKRALEWLKLAYAPLAPAHQSTQELLLRDIIERFENPSIENDDDAKFSLSAMESPNEIIKKLPNRSFKRSGTRGLHDINERSRRMIQEFIRKHNEFYSKPAHVRQLKLAGIV